MVCEGRLLIKDELREINVGSKSQDRDRKRTFGKTSAPLGSDPKHAKVEGAKSEGLRTPLQSGSVPLYDSDGDMCEEAPLSTRKVGSQIMRYRVDRGPRPDREQLQAMRSEFVNKKVLLTGTITRLGMSEGWLCVDVKIGKDCHLHAERWVGLEGCMQPLEEAAPAVAALSEHQEVVGQLRSNLA
jgi:hypothetical protein